MGLGWGARVAGRLPKPCLNDHPCPDMSDPSPGSMRGPKGISPPPPQLTPRALLPTAQQQNERELCACEEEPEAPLPKVRRAHPRRRALGSPSSRPAGGEERASLTVSVRDLGQLDGSIQQHLAAALGLALIPAGRMRRVRCVSGARGCEGTRVGALTAAGC